LLANLVRGGGVGNGMGLGLGLGSYATAVLLINWLVCPACAGMGAQPTNFFSST